MGQSDLPVAGWEKHVKAFERLGWTKVRDNPHILLTKPGHRATLSLPRHSPIKRALLARQIQIAGVTEDEYLDAFHKGKRKH